MDGRAEIFAYMSKEASIHPDQIIDYSVIN